MSTRRPSPNSRRTSRNSLNPARQRIRQNEAHLQHHCLDSRCGLGRRGAGFQALHRGEALNATWFVAAAACCYLVAYRLYSAFVAAKILALDDTRATPCERHDDGRDFVPTNKWVLFGHHFAAIAGPGPLVGPTLAAQFGYLPGTLWLIAGAAFAGCVQDFVILFCSIRRDGKSIGQM